MSNNQIDNEENKIDDVKQKPSIVAIILIATCSTFWFFKNNIPIVPIGAIIAIIMVLALKRYKLFIPLIVGTIIGSIGTGFYFQVNKYNNTTSFNYGFLIGARTFYGYPSKIEKQKITIFNDNLNKNDVDAGLKVIDKFITNFNNKNFSNLANAMETNESFTKEKGEVFFKKAIEMLGAIKQSKYIGYIKHENMPNNLRVYTFFYSCDFEKYNKDSNNYKYMNFIFAANYEKQTFAKINFMQDVEFIVK